MFPFKNLLKKRYGVIAAVLTAAVVLNFSYTTPILIYGKIGDQGLGPERGIPLENFAKQMEFLRAHQYRVLSLQTYLDIIKQKRRLPWKSVIVTFDGGYESVFVNAFPVMKKIGFPATVFLRPERVSKSGYMTDDDVSILLDHAVDLGCLEWHNPFSAGLEPEEVGAEAADCRESLERRFNNGVYFYRYPDGGFALSLRDKLPMLGYRGAVLTGPGAGYGHRDPYALKRVRVERRDGRLFLFWLKVSGFYTYIEALRDWAYGLR